MSFEFWFSLKMNNQFSYVSFFPLTSSDHIVWMLWYCYLYLLHFIHFISSLYFGFTLKFDPFHLISLISTCFSIVYFSLFSPWFWSTSVTRHYYFVNVYSIHQLTISLDVLMVLLLYDMVDWYQGRSPPIFVTLILCICF